MLTVFVVLGSSALLQNLDLPNKTPVQEAAPATAVSSPAPVAAGPNPASVSPSSSLGKIVMYRPAALMGAGIACPIRYKGQELVELGRGKYAEWQVPPGRYILNNKTASVEVHVDPGEVRYVRCQIKPGFMTGRADLQIVDEESFGDSARRYPKKEVVDPLAR